MYAKVYVYVCKGGRKEGRNENKREASKGGKEVEGGEKGGREEERQTHSGISSRNVNLLYVFGK